MGLTARNRRFFRYAERIAETSDFRRVHIGCVIVLGNKVVASTCNTEKGHPVQNEYNRYRGFYDGVGKLHAEIRALAQIKHLNLPSNKLEVYIWRCLKDGTLALARPCPACRAALIDAGIRHIYYTDNGSFHYEEIEQ